MSVPEPSSAEFGSFYRATVASLRGYLARVLSSRFDAEDVAHDAYAWVYAAMSGQLIVRPRAFLFTTARRLAFNQLRRRRSTPLEEMTAGAANLAASGAPSVERLLIAREDWARIERELALMPPGCQAVLLLCKLERLSHAEIAARLGIAVSTVEKRHTRALRHLRDIVATDQMESAPARPMGAEEAQ